MNDHKNRLELESIPLGDRSAMLVWMIWCIFEPCSRTYLSCIEKMRIRVAEIWSYEFRTYIGLLLKTYKRALLPLSET